MRALSNNPPIEFPGTPSIGESFERRQWDGSKWIPAGLTPIWELAGDAPDDGLSYGRTEGDWRVLTPFQHVLTVRHVGVQGVTPGVWELLAWDTVDVDAQGAWDNSTKRFTPNVPGLYLFQCLTPAGSAFIMLKNSGVADHLYQIAASHGGHPDQPAWYITRTTIAQMNGTTDFVNTWLTQATATEFNTGGGFARTEFSAYRLPSWSR